MKLRKIYSIFMLIIAISFAACKNNDNPAKIVKPTPEQLEWANAEVGVLIHMDVQNFVPDYNWREWGTHPDAKVFNPKDLNTDQWMEAASKIGAKYAVLVAKHCSGFSLWPTEAHEYSIKNSPWKDGKGDIVADFVASCKKYGIKPGIYASTTANGYCMVDNPGLVQQGSKYTQEQYNRIVEKQLTELWTNYGELFEIWFDGGVLPVAEGGADVVRLINQYQPQAVAFQGPYGHANLVRWVGNEEGVSPDPCWATADSVTSSAGVLRIEGMMGNPDGEFWCPGEADFTLRYNSSFAGGWFWAAGEDSLIFDVPQLMEKYKTSVGRNTNMLIGIVIDDRGLVPEADVVRLEEFGKAIKSEFGMPLAQNSGKGMELITKLEKPTQIRNIVVSEDIAEGERILEYSIDVMVNGKWEAIQNGTAIGNKRIVAIDKPSIEAARITVNKSKAEPIIKELGLY